MGREVEIMSPRPPAAVTRATTTVRGPGGRRFGVRLWLPALGTGSDGKSPAAASGWPLLAFGHGHLAAAGAYDGFLSRVASAGFVVAAPESERSLFPDHAVLAEDLWRVLRWAAGGAAGVRGLAGAVAPDRLGVLGHSMGGGCALLAAAAHPRVRSVATLAAARTRPSALEAAAALEVPALFVAAERDTVAPVAVHQRILYEAVRTGTPAQLRVIKGGTHAGFLDPIGPWGAGLRPGRLTRAEQITLAADLVVTWLRLTLGGCSETWDAVWDPPVAERDGVTLEVRSAPRRA